MIHVSILWHQHQPMYRDFLHPGRVGYCLFPWVRLHALRDYYSMPVIAASHAGIHLTVNFSPVLLRQLQGYGEEGWTDRALEISLTPTPGLSGDDKEYMATHFFDADWHNEIYPYPRFKSIFDKKGLSLPLEERDWTDLRMWFNLAWFAPEFREGEVILEDGTKASVRHWVEKGEGFSESDIREMVDQQRTIIRNVVAVHRRFQEEGRIEVSVSPYSHPILPLLMDSGKAILDRDGAELPEKIHYPEDAEVQVAAAVEMYGRLFGRKPRGMWPAEGAVGESVVPVFARHGISWIATDKGVLKRSGVWGYQVDDPRVLARVWRAGDAPEDLAIFFRDTGLSDAIGFRYSREEPGKAAADFLRDLKTRFRPGPGGEIPMVTVALDGENAWGGYSQSGRPFLHALYGLLESDPEIRTITFSQCLEGDKQMGIPPCIRENVPKVHALAHASWIDEGGSRPGNDLGTWIGEPMENRAWDLLRKAREALFKHDPEKKLSLAWEAFYAAEGSDWFWWYGEDQETEAEPEFDALFRNHLRSAYTLAGLPPSVELDLPLFPRTLVWTFHAPIRVLFPGDRLQIRTGCAGTLFWGRDGLLEEAGMPMKEAGGVMAGISQYSATLGPFAAPTRSIDFQFHCKHADSCTCGPENLCFGEIRHQILLAQ